MGELKPRPDSYVYLIEAVGSGRYKIGKAKSPTKRLTELQTGSPYPLLLRHSVPGGVRLEHRLHHEYADYRVCGEWFELTDALVDGWPAVAGSRLPRVPPEELLLTTRRTIGRCPGCNRNVQGNHDWTQSRGWNKKRTRKRNRYWHTDCLIGTEDRPT